MNNKKPTLGILFGVYFVSLISNIPMFASVAGPSIMAVFPDATDSLVSQIVTLPQLTGLVTILLAGVLGDKIGKKNIGLFGAALWTIFGALAGTAKTLTQILIYRGIMGLGMGCLLPLGVALVMDFFSNSPKLNNYMSAQSFIMNLGGIVGSALVGALVQAISWKWAFFIHIIGVILFVSFLCLPGKKDWPVAFAGPGGPGGPAGPGPDAPKAKLPAKVFLMAFMLIFFTIAQTGYMQSLPFIISDNISAEQAPILAGTVMSTANLVAMIMALAFPFAAKLAKKYMPTLCMAFVAVGILITSKAPSYAFLIVGAIVFGIGQGMFQPTVFTMACTLAGPATMQATSLLSIAASVGGYAFSIIFIPLCQKIGGFGFGAQLVATCVVILAIDAAAFVAFSASLKFNPYERPEMPGPGGPGPDAPQA